MTPTRGDDAERSVLIRLTAQQISTIRESLSYSSKHIRDSSYDGEDQGDAYERRLAGEERLASARAALSAPVADSES